MPPGGHITSDSDLESVISLQVGRTKSRRHSGGEKYFCSVEGCSQSFTRLDHLDRHVYKHTGIKKHACHFEGCTKTYSILTHLKRHIRCTHERSNKEPNKTVPCEVDTCSKLFTSTCNMKRHIREVHENPKVYKCQFCDEKFSQKLKMRRHEISKHTGVYPHTCDKCSKGFYQKWQWEKHEETCKIYACLTCDKKFDKWTVFLKHCKDTQHARHYYKCEYCDSAYVKPSDLQKHVAAKHISEGESQAAGEYKCKHEGCERSYAYERNLRQHIATAHGGKTFDCTNEDCDKVFSSLQNLQKHIQRDHTTAKRGKASTSKKKTDKTLKRKKRKDAGIPKISNLALLTGIAVDKDLNKKLKSRDTAAMEKIASQFSQQMDVDSSYSEQEVVDGDKIRRTNENAMDQDDNEKEGSNQNDVEGSSKTMDSTAKQERKHTNIEKDNLNIKSQEELKDNINLAKATPAGVEEVKTNSVAAATGKEQPISNKLNENEEENKYPPSKEKLRKSVKDLADKKENTPDGVNGDKDTTGHVLDKEQHTSGNINKTDADVKSSPSMETMPTSQNIEIDTIIENQLEKILSS